MAKATMRIGILVGLVLSGAAAAKGGAVASVPDWDTKAAAELKSIEEKFADAWNKQDPVALKGMVAEDLWSSWDMDMAMKPASWSSKAEMDKFFDEAIASMKKMGSTMTWKTTRLDCRVSGVMGICMQQGEATMTVPKMPSLTVALNNTDVFAKEKGAWKIVHHHGAVGKEPPLPSKMVAVSSKTASGWTDGSADMPGTKVLPIWMNPADMDSAALMKVTQNIKEARHIHPYAFTFAVLEGSVITTDAMGKDVEYGPGTVIYRAPNEPHQTTLKAGAVLFVVTHGPMMSIPVDEKGQPAPHAAR